MLRGARRGSRPNRVLAAAPTPPKPGADGGGVGRVGTIQPAPLRPPVVLNSRFWTG